MNRNERRASRAGSRQAPASSDPSSLGIALQREGRLDEALQVFEKAVQLKPDAASWKNLANVLFQLQRADLAQRAYREVLKLESDDWDAACRSGYLHYQSGQLEQALACFDVCDRVRPNHASTLYMRTVFLIGLGRFEKAVEEGTRAHALDPGNADTCHAVGVALQELRRNEQALPWFERALKLRPEFDSALYHSAVALAKLQRTKEAFAAYERLMANRRNGNAITDLQIADLLIALNHHQDALQLLDRCDEAQPNHARVLQLRAVCLRGLKQTERSLADSRRAHDIDPGNASICNNIGVLLNELGRYQEALVWSEKACALQPGDVEALDNLANVQVQLGHFAAAFATYDRAKTIDPDNANTTLGAAHLQLLHGDFALGWAGREARWKVPGLPIVRPTYPAPIWLDQTSIAGKTILIYADEGMGDAIQMVRYAPVLSALGATVIVVVHGALVRLLSGVAGVSLCLSNQTSHPELPPFDVFCPMLSLPLALGTALGSIPADVPYLPLPAEQAVQAWEAKLPPRGRPRVGLVWSGNPNHGGDRKRSIPFQALARILDADVSFVSLQKELRSEDAPLLAASGVIDLTHDLKDFSDTTALMACLDLIVTVDTSVAHLAGALGRLTWVLLPYVPDYRWLLDREDSPWYPSLRLFRQTETCDYATVLDRVRTGLIALAQGKAN